MDNVEYQLGEIVKGLTAINATNAILKDEIRALNVSGEILWFRILKLTEVISKLNSLIEQATEEDNEYRRREAEAWGPIYGTEALPDEKTRRY